MKLKTNFEIACNDDQLHAYREVLKSLGYIFYSEGINMRGWDHLTTARDGRIQFGKQLYDGRRHFSFFGDFLVWHFTPEKSQAEKELDTLNDKMKELQAQMDKLKVAIAEEKK